MQEKFLISLFEKIDNANYQVEFWDGEVVTQGTAPYKVKIIIKNPVPWSSLLNNPILTLGEAYMAGKIKIKGNFQELIKIINQANNHLPLTNLIKKSSAGLTRLNNKLFGYQPQTEVQHHYDIGNDFFSLWLDQSMNYSCAYFKSPTDSLYQAQLQKIDHILKKMQLQPGEKLLDIGCGWGGLIIKAAQEYNVNALGITLSEEQYQKTSQRIKKLNLQKQVTVKLIDFQNLSPQNYKFDKIVSVGMFEHLGKENYPVYMKKVNQLLKPGGLSLLHTITTWEEGPTNSWIKKYIFPGGYIPAVKQIVSLLPEYNFNLLHAENLRRHYALTLEKWHRNFCREIRQVEAMFDQEFVRMWNLFLRSCAANFWVGGLTLHQFLFTKGVNNQINLTNQHIHN
ncbi:SAM-dependent methyltransferase [Halanaerobacter jeridensis]|uniref:Cyclopropane-fatty-acyl-phospholipid synthase n=1 Tax=Halanaerobacter jeridensis TaxID=706427 RepID=A0A939BP55_9FIRM|nr:cyclopropane-fatty-acyl-phospholipid synthase family protein [Halanaerobacter jeridensis]MBM7556567.1 cyclopropane-fatty-acyl-phospholipid synthase [Halanaerobacter jeridensis]